MDAVAMRTLFSLLEARRKDSSAAIDLPGADLRGAHLMCADLQGANLQTVSLDKANLAGAKLSGIRLCGASLKKADFTGADLRGADLSRTNVSGALFTAADLRGADVSHMAGDFGSFEGARIDRALCDRAGFDETAIVRLAAAGACIDDLTAFSQAVREACAAMAAASSSVTNLPRSRRLQELEITARRKQNTLPPSSRHGAPHSRPAQAAAMADLPPQTARSPQIGGRGEPPLSGPGERQPGDVVLGVTLVACIGKGNASTVWSGTDEAGVRRAVKVFSRPEDDLPTRAAFVRSVRAMCRLGQLDAASAAGIATIHRTGAADLELVTDLAESGTMADLPALHWTPRQIIPFFTKICHAIDFAHAAGVLHRCLKPSNVLLDEALNPVVTDFDSVDLPALRRESPNAGGYAAYAAPEALSGEGSDQPNADIYSLGRVLHFLLLGADPKAHITAAADLSGLEGYSERLLRIIRKCTMRDPAERYARVADLLADLSLLQGTEALAVDQRTTAGVPDNLPPSSRQAPPSSMRVPPSSRQAPPRSTRALASSSDLQSQAHPDGPVAPGRGLSRRSEKIVALCGAVMLAGFVAVLALVKIPSPALLSVLRIAAAAGGAMLTFALPQFQSRPVSARAVFALAAALLLFLVDLSGLARYRLIATLSSPDASNRAQAIKQLVRCGHRDFDGKDLSSTPLSGGDLSQASFRHAKLTHADLSGAALMESDFDAADLSFAMIRGADLSRTNAGEAKGFELAECDAYTKLPSGWECVDDHPYRQAGPSAAVPDPSPGSETGDIDSPAVE